MEAAKEKAEQEAAEAEAAAAAAEESGEPLPPIPLRETYKMPPEPKPPEKIEIIVPNEKYNEGVNKKVLE